jgi:hypothetical protein
LRIFQFTLPIFLSGSTGMLYLHNFEPDRGPGGVAETGYKDTDDSPTKTAVFATEKVPELKHFFAGSFGKLPADQLFDLRRDPDCMTNLAATVSFAALQKQLFDELNQQGDPRLLGSGHIYDEYPYANATERNFYDWVMRGKKLDGATPRINQ